MPRPLGFRRPWTFLPTAVFFLSIAFAVPFVLWFWFVLSPLQKQYLPAYLGLRATGTTARTTSVWWIWKTAPKRKPELAADADVIAAPVTGPKSLPLALSPAAQAKGWTGLVRAQQVGRADPEAVVLEQHFFAGQSVERLMVTPLSGAAILILLYLTLGGRFGGQSEHEERHGRRTKGPELASALQSRLSLQRSGVRLRLRSKWGLPAASFRIPRKLESSHILLMGDTGSGKSNAIRQILRQVERRGETAIVYDPAGEFVQEFLNPERGDLVLNPLDDRCPTWDVAAEMTGRGVEYAIASAMLPRTEFGNDFFTEAPRRVLARLLHRKPSVYQMLTWMSDPEEIDRRVEGTPEAAYLDRKAGPQRGGVLASLNMIADSLALLPSYGRQFNTALWRHERTRWVFLTSRPSARERILPLHSVWLDLLILRMMEPCTKPAKPVWFVLDELASLNKLPQLHTAVTENRKYGNPVVLGFQGRSQLEKRYGQDAEAMLSQPATKIFFKTSEPRAAKWISETLGEIEVERLKESRSEGSGLALLRGDKKSFAMEIANKPLVTASEIAGLEPLRGYIKQLNRVVPVRFALVKRRSLQPEFIERKMTESSPSRHLVVQPESLKAEVPEPQSLSAASKSADRRPKSAPVATALATAPSESHALFPESNENKPFHPEPRRSAFKKRQGTDEEKAREWKPVD